MSEFKIVENPGFSPTICLTCQRATGPFVDTEVDLLGYGHVWLCVGDEDHPGCIVQMGRLFGAIDPRQAEELRAKIADLELAVAMARDELKSIAKQKTISVQDAITVFGLQPVPEYPSDIPEPLRGIAALYE